MLAWKCSNILKEDPEPELRRERKLFCYKPRKSDIAYCIIREIETATVKVHDSQIEGISRI
jgi:hypothetical protein